MKKIFVVGGCISYARWIDDCVLTNDLDQADIVMFTGGEDVTPSIYGCEKHSRTYCNPFRDDEELEVFRKIRPDQFVIGICRGSQFLCAVNGGILVQHCNNHAMYGCHEITNGTDKYKITSTHHQQQYPYLLDKKDYDLLYWADGIGTIHEGDKIDEKLIIENGEAEIVLYHRENAPVCLAVQGHPEMMNKNESVISMLNNLIQKYTNA